MGLVFLMFLFLFQPSLEDDSMLDKLFYSVELLVNYYKENFAYMNLDGIYGLRILEGQFAVLLQNAAKFNISQKYSIKLKNLWELSSKIAETSIKHVQASDPDYFSQLSALIENPMQFSGTYRRVNQYLKWARSDLKAKGFDETFSDHCMTELVQKREGRSVCEVSEQCLTGMFETGHQEYIILHQILYIMLAREHGCTPVLDSYLRGLGYTGGLDGIMDEFCSNTLFEVVDLLFELTDDLIPDIYQDLFLEQQFVCPSQGYMEFLHIDWLQQILSWQKSTGCYGSMVDKQPTPFNSRQLPNPQILPPQQPSHDIVVQAGVNGQKLVYKRHNSSKEELKTIIRPGNYAEKLNAGMKFVQRKLLEERVLHDGCLSHKTAVAAGALSQYIKFFLNPGPREYRDQVSVTGRNYLHYKIWYSLAFSNNNSDSRHQMELVDVPVDRNRQLKNYRLGRAAVDDKEERYQNQVNMPQPMYLGENVYKKYPDRYNEQNEQKNEDPQGYYDDDEEEAEADQGHQSDDDVDDKAGQNPVEDEAAWANGVKKVNVDFPNANLHEAKDPFRGENPLKDMLDLQKFEHEKNDDADPGYGYYDESEKSDSHNTDKKALLKGEKLQPAHQLTQTGSSNLNLVQSYFIMLVAMTGLMAFMYRFVRKRRIVIRYR